MSESTQALIQVLSFIVALMSAYWVWTDSNKLKRGGARLTPFLWTAMVFLAWLIALPIYLLLRHRLWARQTAPPVGERDTV